MRVLYSFNPVSQSKIWPASVRLIDNKQFKFGMALKTESNSKWHDIIDKGKKFFVTDVMKFNPDNMTLCTIVFEGSKEEVTNQQNSVYRLAKKHHGFKAGAENGERGYFLTFMIGYLRDFALKYDFVAESFETSIPWKDISKMCKAVEKRIVSDCKKVGVKKEPFISFRVTQVPFHFYLRSTTQEQLSTSTSASSTPAYPIPSPYTARSKTALVRKS